MFIVHVFVQVKPDCLAAFREASIENARHSIQEPGVVRFDLIDWGVRLARSSGATGVGGFGRGSVLDSYKTIAGLTTNRGEITDYLEVIGKGKPLATSDHPLCAIPTTAGTGAEVTKNAVLGAPEHRVKVSLRISILLPAVVWI